MFADTSWMSSTDPSSLGAWALRQWLPKNLTCRSSGVIKLRQSNGKAMTNDLRPHLEAGVTLHEIGDARLDDAEDRLARDALAVLDANWLGHATSPGALYPHQWSWDSACISMGRSAWDQDRAERELRSLFAGQWTNGLLPHIVFTGSNQYFPGPAFWQAERSAYAP